jgi:hypothetical protein
VKLADFPRLLAVLSTAWDTSGGMAARRLIWSLYGARVGRDGGMLGVQLWDAISSLDESLRLELACLISQTLDAREALCKALLTTSGEMDRIDDHPLFET